MPTRTQGQILRQMASGTVIRVEHINYAPSAARIIYRLGLDTIRAATVKRLLADRLIKPENDGLFGVDGPVQSYTLFRTSEGGA